MTDELTENEKAALTYCAPHGIPLSVFLGRIVYPGEPMWLPRDVQGVFWWLQVCKTCGHHPEETFGPGEQDKWNAEMSGHCDGCRALERASLMAAGSDDPVSPAVGARYRMWRDKDTNGHLELTG